MNSSFGSLESLRNRAIPDQAAVYVLKQGYRTHPLDNRSRESREGLVDIRDLGILGENHYSIARNPPYYHRIEGSISSLLVREGVGNRLRKIQDRLHMVGLSLWVFDAWRPNEVQKYFHDIWMPKKIVAEFGDIDQDLLKQKVEKYWASSSTSKLSPAPHITGSAIDLTICWKDTKQLLWMGSLFDDVSEVSHLDHFEKLKNDRICYSDEEALHNRRLLYWLMSDAEFSANPSEWWHYSYGDQMWARLGNHRAAIYPAADIGMVNVRSTALNRKAA